MLRTGADYSNSKLPVNYTRIGLCGSWTAAQWIALITSVSPGWMVAEANLLLRCNWATVVLYSAAMLDKVSPGFTL